MLAKSETKLLLLAASISRRNKTIMITTTDHRDLQEPGRVRPMAKSRIGGLASLSGSAAVHDVLSCVWPPVLFPLLYDEADSAAASQAIHDVVASVRTSHPLGPR
jgi:hypothetical protein